MVSVGPGGHKLLSGLVMFVHEWIIMIRSTVHDHGGSARERVNDYLWAKIKASVMWSAPRLTSRKAFFRALWNLVCTRTRYIMYFYTAPMKDDHRLRIFSSPHPLRSAYNYSLSIAPYSSRLDKVSVLSMSSAIRSSRLWTRVKSKKFNSIH